MKGKGGNGMKRKSPPEEPIETTIVCPECKTKIDIKHIKQAIKQRLDLELDYWLDKL